MINLLAISGSMRRASTNTARLTAAANLCPDGTRITLFKDLEQIPIFNVDREVEQTPAAVMLFADAVAQADGLIISSPEYAFGIPGGLKNALDWLVSRDEIPGKPVMLMHASHRGDTALAALKTVLTAISVNLIEDAAYRIDLMGKTPEEITIIFHDSENQELLRKKLAIFAAAI